LILCAGFNIVLISRTESKLQAVAADLESCFSVQTKVVPADFAAATEDTWETISAVVSSVPVGVLVNSAGVSYDHAGERQGPNTHLITEVLSLSLQACLWLANSHKQLKSAKVVYWLCRVL
jgi:short-subunit dehydrogenase